MSVPIKDHFISAPDGLKLHAREYGAAPSRFTPVLCLPGLARTAADFAALAEALAGDAERPRRVIALSYRGRGLSARDPDWKNYAIPVEMSDVFAIADALGIGPAIVVGTSRGGLISMAIAAQRPTMLAGVVLNDIGPVLETAGLVRIKGYVGKLPQPRDFDEAAAILEAMGKTQFPAASKADWQRAARQTWVAAEDGTPALSYDPALTHTLDGFDPAVPLPPAWPLFDALGAVPVLTIRGALSDLLSIETVAEMAKRHPRFESLTVPDQGHAPWLADAATIRAIVAFAARCDGDAGPH